MWTGRPLGSPLSLNYRISRLRVVPYLKLNNIFAVSRQPQPVVRTQHFPITHHKQTQHVQSRKMICIWSTLVVSIWMVPLMSHAQYTSVHPPLIRRILSQGCSEVSLLCCLSNMKNWQCFFSFSGRAGNLFNNCWDILSSGSFFFTKNNMSPFNQSWMLYNKWHFRIFYLTHSYPWYYVSTTW